MRADKFAPRQQKIRRPVLGDMRHKIFILLRNITPINTYANVYDEAIYPPSYAADPVNSVNFDELFTITNSVFAAVETVRGDSVFDGTTIKYAISTIFKIRYIGDLTEERFVRFQNNHYEIVDIEPLDLRNQFMALRCNLLGDASLQVNKA